MKQIRRSSQAIGLMALACMAMAASAQSTGRLYDPMPPDDSAYVRVVQATQGQAARVLVDGRERVRQLPARQAGEYLVVPAGKRRVQLQSGNAARGPVMLDAASRGAYTITFNASGAPYVFTDRTGTNRLKAMLAVYHMAPGAGAIDITTADGKTKVFSNLRAGQPAILEVNPIQVNLVAVRSGTTTPIANASLRMTQGGAYSIFLFPAGAQGVSAMAVENKRERYTGN